MKTDTRNPMFLPWVLALLGFSAVVAQITLMRELIVVFNGNEISLGVTLAVWLLWTATGSGVLGRFAARSKHPVFAIAVLQVAVAVVLPATIAVIRGAGVLFGLAAGEVAGPGLMFAVTAVALSGFCLLSGLMFAAGGRLHTAIRGSATADATANVYFYESVGAGAGGLFAGLLFAQQMSPFGIVLVVSLLNLVSAAKIAAGRTAVARLTVLAGATVLLLVVVPPGARLLESRTLNYLWRGIEPGEVAYSAYGNLAVTGGESSQTVFENGVPLFTSPDPEAAEEAVHLALLQHPSPSRVLLIGGGAGGALAEVLKHQTVENVDYVELDPAVLGLADRHAGGDWKAARDDPRAAIYDNTDGRMFVNKTDRTWDVIIVNVPDPRNAGLNRFYTAEFFRAAHRRLSANGVLTFGLSGAENFISEDLSAFLRCVQHTLSSVFDRVVVFPGATVRFFAGGPACELTDDAGTLTGRLGERGVETVYVNEYYLPFRLSPDRLRDIRQAVKPGPDTQVNTDFSPVAYYFNNVLWSTRFHDGYRAAFRAAGRVGFPLFLAVLSVLLLAAVLVIPARRGGPGPDRAAAGTAVAAMGFTMLGLQVVLLLAFQCVYGYVYQQLALLVAAFMTGLAAGSRLSLRRLGRSSTLQPRSVLLALQLLAGVLPVVFVVVAKTASGIGDPSVTAIVAGALFPVMALLSGGLGGWQFPVAGRLYYSGATTSSPNPGAVYALDIAGAFAGAVVISVYLIPVFGFLNTSFVLAVVNAAPAILLWRGGAGRTAQISGCRAL
jgi:spermidine synthase